MEINRSGKLVEGWWSNPAQVQRLARWMMEKGFIHTAEESAEVFMKPYKFQAQYAVMQDDITRRITAEAPPSMQFFDDRFYRIGNEWFPSVTTILWAYPNPQLTSWIADVGTAQAELRKTVGGEIGSRVHDALQHNVPIDRDDFGDEEFLRLMYAKQFHDQYQPTLMFNEEVIWDADEGYAGRFDRIVMMNGKLTLIDFKTGWTGRECWLQLAAYKQAVEKLKAIRIESWGLVSLKAQVKDGWKYYPIEERTDVKELSKLFAGELPEDRKTEAVSLAVSEAFKNDMEVFRAVHRTWKDVFRNVRPKSFPFPPPQILDISIPVDGDPVPKKKAEEPKPEAATTPELSAPAPVQVRRRRIPPSSTNESKEA